MKIVGISGSLRKGSYNTAALRAAVGLAPPAVTIEIAEIGDLPLFNEDVRLAGYPPPAARFRAALAAADAVLIVTPEYNYSVSGGLKNALDWASRPPDQPFNGKPVAIMGANQGLFGTARAQYHLRQILLAINAQVVTRPEVMIGQAQTKFDAAGKLTDEPTGEFIRKLIQSLVDWTRRLAATVG